MKVLVVIYWVWFAISVVVLTRRVIRRIFGRSDTAPTATSQGATTGSVLMDSLAKRVHDRAARAAFDTTSVPPAESAPESVPAMRPLPQPARSPIAGARATLADALAGIAMPADLAPLTLVSGADMVHRAVFATTSTTLEQVDAEVLAELERLGYELDRVGPHASLARRGDDALALRLHVIGPQPKKGPAHANYPTAPASSVVLDVELA